MVLTAMLLTAMPITVFAQTYSGTCIVTVGSKGKGQVSPEGELSVWPGEKMTFDVIPYEGLGGRDRPHRPPRAQDPAHDPFAHRIGPRAGVVIIR